jgi:FkbM family methyltransferase
MWTLPLVGKRGKVYSFEPSPVNLSILELHRTRNSFPQWVIVPKAVSDTDAQEEEFFLVDSGDSPMNSLTTGVPGTPLMGGRDIRKTAIRVITLDTFCSAVNLRPDVVKIDVEGAELMVLRGAAELLVDRAQPSFWPCIYWLPTGQSSQQIFELLTGMAIQCAIRKGAWLIICRAVSTFASAIGLHLVLFNNTF